MRSTFGEIVSQKNRLSEMLTFFLTFSDDDFGCFRRDFCEFVGIVAWNLDEKCCQGLN